MGAWKRIGGSKELTSNEQTNKEQGLSAGIMGTGREAGAGRRADGVGDQKGRECRAQSPRGLQLIVTKGLSAHCGCAGGSLISYAIGAE